MKSKHSNSRKLFSSYHNALSNLGEPVNTPMDWSEDTPVQAVPPPYVPLVGEHMPLPHVSLSQGTGANNSINKTNMEITVLNYGNN